MTNGKAMKLALEALKGLKSLNRGCGGLGLSEINRIHRNNDTAIKALEEALKQEQGKPLAWYDPSNGSVSTDKNSSSFTPLGQIVPLYDVALAKQEQGAGLSATSDERLMEMPKQWQEDPVAIVAVGGVTNKIDVGWLRMPKHNDKLYTTPQPKQEQGEQETNRLIQQRDHAHEIIDKLCDAVLGFDRHEWSSAYFFEDAVNEVEEKMWQLAKQEQGEPVAWDCCANCLRPEHEHNDGQCPKPFTTIWHAWDYDSPPDNTPQKQRKSLTDDEIWKNDDIMAANSGYGANFETLREVVRATEAAHNIKD